MHLVLAHLADLVGRLVEEPVVGLGQARANLAQAPLDGPQAGVALDLVHVEHGVARGVDGLLEAESAHEKEGVASIEKLGHRVVVVVRVSVRVSARVRVRARARARRVEQEPLGVEALEEGPHVAIALDLVAGHAAGVEGGPVVSDREDLGHGAAHHGPEEDAHADALHHACLPTVGFSLPWPTTSVFFALLFFFLLKGEFRHDEAGRPEDGPGGGAAREDGEAGGEAREQAPEVGGRGDVLARVQDDGDLDEDLSPEEEHAGEELPAGVPMPGAVDEDALDVGAREAVGDGARPDDPRGGGGTVGAVPQEVEAPEVRGRRHDEGDADRPVHCLEDDHEGEGTEQVHEEVEPARVGEHVRDCAVGGRRRGRGEGQGRVEGDAVLEAASGDVDRREEGPEEEREVGRPHLAAADAIEVEDLAGDFAIHGGDLSLFLEDN